MATQKTIPSLADIESARRPIYGAGAVDHAARDQIGVALADEPRFAGDNQLERSREAEAVRPAASSSAAAGASIAAPRRFRRTTSRSRSR